MPTARIPIDLSWTTASGSPGVNVFHARADSIDQFNPDFNDLAELLRVFYDTISGTFANAVTIHFDGEMQGVGDDSDNTYGGDPWTVTGTGGTDFAPPANCLLVNWRAATGGRSGRGRTFLGPCAEGTVEGNGTPQEVNRADVQSGADDLVSSSQGFANGAVGIYSRTENIFRDFVAADVPNFFAVLRSRRD